MRHSVTMTCALLAIVQSDKADHRPVGVAVAPDGAPFITDDNGGRIWRVTYTDG